MARKTKLTPEAQEKLLRYLRLGCYVETAAACAGISRDTFYDWMKRGGKGEKLYKQFAEAVDQAMAESEARDLAVILKAAEKNWTAAAWRLERRFAVLAATLGAERGSGKACAWDVEFSGASADAVAEGSDVAPAEFTTDPLVPAQLGWAHYRQSFAITETEIDAAASSVGTPDALMDMFGERVLGAHQSMCAKINADLFTGTGTAANGNPNLVGLFGGPLEPTGIYASIPRATYGEWAGNVLANGNVPRPLTIDLMAQMEQNVFTACGEPPNLIVASAGVLRKYENMFETVRRVVSDGRGPMEYGAGASNLFYKGIPVVRDRNCSVGKMAFLNTNYIRVKYLPHINPGDALGHAESRLSSSSGSVQLATDIPARIVLLAKTGDAVKASVKTTIQLAVKRPNANGYIADIAEI